MTEPAGVPIVAPPAPPTPLAVPPAGSAPVTTTTTTTVVPVKPGLTTSEHVLAVIVVLLMTLEGSNLIPVGSGWNKAIVMALQALTALGYGVNRTSLKKAAMRTAQAMMLVAVVLMMPACGAQQGSGGAGSGSGSNSAKPGFLACGKADLAQMVGDKTLLATVAAELLSANYVAAIATLVAKLGADAVGCAVLAIEQVDGAKATPTPTTADEPANLRAARARELIASYKWAP